MPFLKNRERKVSNIKEIEKINGIIKKYVNLNKLYLKFPFEELHIEFVDRPEDDILILKSNEGEIKEKIIKVFTIISNRYIEFELENVSDGNFMPENTYRFKIVSCSLALDKRATERYIFTANNPKLTHISILKVKETEAEIRKSITAQIIVKDCIEKVSGFDYKQFFYKNDDGLPAEIMFAIERNDTFYIENLNDVQTFFNDNKDILHESQPDSLKSNLEISFKNLAKEYKSILVKPVQYAPVDGVLFPIGYLMIAKKEGVIEEEEINNIDKISEEISVKVRNSNYVESEGSSTIVDLSLGGLRTEITDKKLVKQISVQDVILFNLVFKLRDPIRMSGSIVFIHEENEGTMIGIEFLGSHFGPEFKKVLSERLKDFVDDQ